MKKTLQIITKVTFVVLAFLGFANRANAQCLAGEVAVSFDITTDTWGYEFYWELAPTGSGCGTPATLFAGGTTAVGCAGGGLQTAAAGPGSYGNSTTVTEGPFCLTIGSQYDIIMVDDWGDGATIITSVQQGVNVTMAGPNQTVTFTAMAPPTGADLAMTATPVPYTIYPLSQATNIVGGGNMANIGAIDAGNSIMTVNVYDGAMTQVYTATSAPATVPVGGNANFTVPGYTPTMVGNYLVEYISSTDSLDANQSNDTTRYIVQVDDSTYARDYANVEGIAGTLGIGAGAGQNARLGQTFNLVNADTLTSIDIFIGNQNGRLVGQPLQVHIYATAAGLPTTLLKSTVAITMDTTTNTLWNLSIQDGLALPAGLYAVAVEETDSNISVGNTLKVFTTNSIFVKWDGNAGGAWSPVEGFGGAFSKPFVIRPNFGVPPLTVGVKELATTSFEVYPNPVVNSVNVKNANVGSTIEIFNNLGQLVHTDVVRSNNLNIDVAKFDNGVYTIKNTSNDNVITQSFVKQ